MSTGRPKFDVRGHLIIARAGLEEYQSMLLYVCEKHYNLEIHLHNDTDFNYKVARFMPNNGTNNALGFLKLWKQNGDEAVEEENESCGGYETVRWTFY